MDRIDINTAAFKSALKAQTINSATTTVGIEIDATGAEDINFGVTFDDFTSGDFSVQIFEADATGMAGETLVPASVVEGAPYNTVITPDPVDGNVFHYHIKRTMAKGFLRLKIVSADTPVADLSAMSVLGSLRRSDLTSKNPT